MQELEAIYDGQRAAAPDQRVVILTRSAFPGQQRYSSATWSGDITSTWTAMRKQIPAGLGFCHLERIPLVDDGHRRVCRACTPSKLSRRDVSDALIFEEWCELDTHAGSNSAHLFRCCANPRRDFPYREMWQFGGDKDPTFQAQLKFDRLRSSSTAVYPIHWPPTFR